MNNSELMDFIISDLQDDYQVGIHSISSLQNFYICRNPHYKYRGNYSLQKKLSCKNIAFNIIHKGLNFFPYRRDGISRTVTLLGHVVFGEIVDYYFNRTVNESSLEYTYWSDPIGEANYNVIVAIPNHIMFADELFYIGDMNDRTSLGNLLLDGVIPQEFIYGYYSYELASDKKNMKQLKVNDKHISKLDDKEKLKFFRRLVFKSPFYKRVKNLIKDDSDLKKHLLLYSDAQAKDYHSLKNAFKSR